MIITMLTLSFIMREEEKYFIINYKSCLKCVCCLLRVTRVCVLCICGVTVTVVVYAEETSCDHVSC